MNADPQCRWHDEHPCEFNAQRKAPIQEYRGRPYCIFHMPLASPLRQQWTAGNFVNAVSQDQTDLRGIQFLQGQLVFPKYKGRAWDLRGCSFPRGAAIHLSGLGFNFDECTFGDPAGPNDPTQIKMQLLGINGSAQFNRIVSHCQFELHPAMDEGSAAYVWSFDDAIFHHVVDFRDLVFKESLSFRHATFHGLTRLEGTRFPQMTVAQGAKFRGAAICPDAEGSFRAARVSFGESRNRELEGMFYALEKRCHRLSLIGWRVLLTRALSAMYDWTAQYGQSYGFALLWFASVQCMFALVYSILAGRFHVPGSADGAVWTFTISQVAKPFELLSARSPMASAYTDIVGSDPSGWWIVATVIHSVLSIALLAMAVLAIRWRFRRE